MNAQVRCWIVLLVLAAGVVSAPPARGANGEYLFDTIKKRAYRASWDALLKGQRVDPWLATFAKTKNGVCHPSKTVTLRGVGYQANFVCKPHDCGDNQFLVLFAPRGRKAWGLLLTDETKQRFFGKPDAEMRAALVKAIRN